MREKSFAMIDGEAAWKMRRKASDSWMDVDAQTITIAYIFQC
jgi:hypothetical protein